MGARKENVLQKNFCVSWYQVPIDTLGSGAFFSPF